METNNFWWSSKKEPITKENLKNNFKINRIKGLMYNNKNNKPDPSFKEKMINLFIKYIKTPILVCIIKIETYKQNLKDKKIRQQFEENTGVSIDRIKFMTSFDGKYGDSKIDYYNEKLKNSRQSINSTNIPCFYEPEIVSVHNENLDTYNFNPLSEVVKKDNDEAKNILIKQRVVADNKYGNTTLPIKKTSSWMPSPQPTNLDEELKTYVHNSLSDWKKEEFLKEKE